MIELGCVERLLCYAGHRQTGCTVGKRQHACCSCCMWGFCTTLAVVFTHSPLCRAAKVFPPLCNRDSLLSECSHKALQSDECQHRACLCHSEPHVSAAPKLNLSESEILHVRIPLVNDVIVEAAWGRWWRRGPETERPEQTRPIRSAGRRLLELPGVEKD